MCAFLEVNLLVKASCVTVDEAPCGTQQIILKCLSKWPVVSLRLGLFLSLYTWDNLQNCLALTQFT